MVPKFSNPHLLVQTALPVSRHDIYARDVEVQDEPVQDEKSLATLESLVKRSLGEVQLYNDQSERKRKRRKIDSNSEQVQGAEDTKQEPLDEVIPYRLVSNSRTPMLISIKPRPVPVFKVMEPACEDDEDEARIRAERAAAVAVDMSWVVKESQRPYDTPPGNGQHITVTANTSFGGPSMFVAQLPKPPSWRGLAPIRTRLPEQTRPSPHNLRSEKLSYPVIECHTAPVQKKRKPRRRGNAEPKERPPPAFWRPLREWGGKSAGYAYGYTSSRPMWTEDIRWRLYRRDNMRTAMFVV